MANQKYFVFVEEGGAGRAIVTKARSKTAAEKFLQKSISGKVRFAETATEAIKRKKDWTLDVFTDPVTNIIQLERKVLVEHLYPSEEPEDVDANQKPFPIRYVYEGPFGKVGISWNDRTLIWQAYCTPEGSSGREVMLPLSAKSEEQAVLEAEAVLRDEATHNREIVPRPSEEEAAAAVKVLLRFAGDNPEREGLLETPRRVVKSFGELFQGYGQSAWDVLNTSFSETGSYDEMVLLTDIEFESHCEHHMVPFIGRAHIAYLPDQTVVGISKLARLVEVYSRRLQIQEKMTTQIADNLNIALQPKGVAVVIEARHMCMTMRGVQKKTVKMVTSCMTGAFRDDAKMKSEFMSMIGSPRSGQA